MSSESVTQSFAPSRLKRVAAARADDTAPKRLVGLDAILFTAVTSYYIWHAILVAR